MSSRPNHSGYQVGYGRPPVHTRFRKGQSGNPQGRRRYTDSERAKQLLRQEVYRTIRVREGDKVVSMPAIQAVLRSMLALAAKGNGPSQRALWRILQESEASDETPKSIAFTWLPPTHQGDIAQLSDEQLASNVPSSTDGATSSHSWGLIEKLIDVRRLTKNELVQLELLVGKAEPPS
jgi:hypothetical protein